MTVQEIHSARLPQTKEKASFCLMDQEIIGTTVTCHVLPEHETMKFDPCKDYIRILFVCYGEVTIQNTVTTQSFSNRGVFVGNVNQDVIITARKDSTVLELCRWLDPSEFDYVLTSSDFPYCMEYSKAPQYTEDCKSPKTISRMLIPQRLIPRFAMGSVETYGKDLIEKHTHPILEQFFFGLEENNCIALIDDLQYPFLSNMLLHIPLGSNHGVCLDDNHACHYLWMDFLLNEDALKYMDEAHKITQ